MGKNVRNEIIVEQMLASLLPNYESVMQAFGEENVLCTFNDLSSRLLLESGSMLNSTSSNVI
jgi:hypothetical protein